MSLGLQRAVTVTPRSYAVIAHRSMSPCWHARQLVRLCMHSHPTVCPCVPLSALACRCPRLRVALSLSGHAECLIANGGFSKSRLSAHTSIWSRPQLLPVVMSGPVRHKANQHLQLSWHASAGTGSRVEKKHLCCHLEDSERLMRAASGWPGRPARALYHAAFSFERATGVALIRMDSAKSVALEDTTVLARHLGPSLRAAAIYLGDVDQLRKSARELAQANQVMRSLRDLGVPIASMRQTIKARASQDATTDVERTVDFAAWLAHHPQSGQTHMLRLTRQRLVSQHYPCSESATALALLQHGTNTRAERSTILSHHMSASLELASKPELLKGCRATLAALRPDAPHLRTASSRKRASVHALEVHNPRYCVHAPALDTHAGGSGHLAHGRLAEWCAANSEDEDAISMALTATRRLMSRCGVKQIEVHRTPIASHSWLTPLLPLAVPALLSHPTILCCHPCAGRRITSRCHGT